MKKQKMFRLEKDRNGGFFIRELKYKKQRRALFIFLSACAVCAVLLAVYTLGVTHA